MFELWGGFVYDRRWHVLVLSGLLLAVIAGIGFTLGGQLNDESTKKTESLRAQDLLTAQLPKNGATGSSFDIVFAGGSLKVTDSAFQAAVDESLLPLRADARVTSVTTPWSVTPDLAGQLESRDGSEALTVVTVKDGYLVARNYYPDLAAKVHSNRLRTYLTGNLPISHDFNSYLGSDLTRAEVASIPLSLILLLIVFGTLVAALLPVGVGGAAVVAGIAGTLLLARFINVSTYAVNVVTLIGLGVAIDYSLFIVNRFREELVARRSVPLAIERSMATAGRAVMFSGLTVAVGLAGMLFYPGTFLVSMGLAGSIVVALAVIFALTFLPALLSILGTRVNRVRVPYFGTPSSGAFWHRLATAVMRRPLVVLIPALGVIALAASPFASIKIANGDVEMLPPQAPSRVGLDHIRNNFPGQDQNTLVVVVHYTDGQPLLASDRIGQLYDYGQELAGKKNVLRVSSPVNLGSSFGRADYQRLLTTDTSQLPDQQRQTLKQTLGKDIAVFYLQTNKPTQSDDAFALLRSIRNGDRPAGADLLVTGGTAFNQDFIDLIVNDTPVAILFVIVVTYLVLFLLLGSVILPLKAVITNLLSISASFGAIVWIFQQGHLSGLLNFTPQPIDPTLPVLTFCIVFGLSMDYEVMLLTRIQEEYKRSGDNTQAVATGLERSGRLITGAAAIMIGVFLAFGLAEVVLIKAIGLGLALAVLIDATLMRMLIVPALMRILGRLNWWAPHPLARLHASLPIGETEAPQPA